MVINLITFASLLHKQASVRSSHEIILTELEKYFTVNFVDYQDISKLTSNDFSILFIATGGVERLVIQHFESLPRPAIILADGMQNSLAAALEVSSWLRGRGMKSEILHGELPEIIKRIFVLHSNFMAQRSLFGMRIGVIGTPSSWLIASNVDYLLAKRRWGVEYTDVSLDRIYEYYNQITDDERQNTCCQRLIKRHAGLISQPARAKQIAHDGAENHADHARNQLCLKTVNRKSANQSHKDKADQVSAGRSKQLANAAAEAGKDRQTNQAEQQIHNIANRAAPAAQYINRQINGKIGQRDRNDANRNRQRA